MSKRRIPNADCQQRLGNGFPGNLDREEKLAECTIDKPLLPKHAIEACQTKWDSLISKYESYVTNEEFDTTVHNLNMHRFSIGKNQFVADDEALSPLASNSDEEDVVDFEGYSNNDHASEPSEEESGEIDETEEHTETYKYKEGSEPYKETLFKKETFKERIINMEDKMVVVGDDDAGFNLQVQETVEERQMENNAEEDENDAEQEEEDDNQTEIETDDNCEEENIKFLESDKEILVNDWLINSSFTTDESDFDTLYMTPVSTSSLLAGASRTRPVPRSSQLKPGTDFAQEMEKIQRSLDIINESDTPTIDPSLSALESWHCWSPEVNAGNFPPVSIAIPVDAPIIAEISEILGDFVPNPISPMAYDSPIQRNDELSLLDNQNVAPNNTDTVSLECNVLMKYCLAYNSANKRENELYPHSMQSTNGSAPARVEGNKTENRLNVVRSVLDGAVESQPAVIVDSHVKRTVNGFGTSGAEQNLEFTETVGNAVVENNYVETNTFQDTYTTVSTLPKRSEFPNSICLLSLPESRPKRDHLEPDIDKESSAKQPRLSDSDRSSDGSLVSDTEKSASNCPLLPTELDEPIKSAPRPYKETAIVAKNTPFLPSSYRRERNDSDCLDLVGSEPENYNARQLAGKFRSENKLAKGQSSTCVANSSDKPPTVKLKSCNEAAVDSDAGSDSALPRKKLRNSDMKKPRRRRQVPIIPAHYRAKLYCNNWLKNPRLLKKYPALETTISSDSD